MALTYRETKGSALTIAELDGNFQFFTGSHSITGSLIVTQAITASSLSGSFTGSFLGTSSYATQALSASYAPNTGATVSTASLLTTASATNNIITFTKGDASTFTVTVATGSGGGSTNTGSLLTTASAVGPVITFTKGDASTFTVTVATGSVVSASYATQALSASYFSGSINGATFTGDVNFTSGSNVDGLFVVVMGDSALTGGLQVHKGDSFNDSRKFASLNCQDGGGRLVGVDKSDDTPSMFIMLQDATTNLSVMEFRTLYTQGVGSTYVKINTTILPTTEPSVSGQLWRSGSVGGFSKFLCIRD
jgi:hypothetical protein